jgi:hypothetical protein
MLDTVQHAEACSDHWCGEAGVVYELVCWFDDRTKPSARTDEWPISVA